MALSSNEKLARLRLIRTENVGPVTFKNLIMRYKSAEAAVEALPELAKQGGRKKPLKAYPKQKAEQELDELHKQEGFMLVQGDVDYPPALEATEDAPPVLFGFGQAHLLERPNFAIVGARNASAVGLKLATKFAAEIGDDGYVITSGMARGIDGAVHRGALEKGTVAILAGGIDVIYPRENGDIYEEIKKSGLILSEMPLGVQPQARHFPRRNRIISGLARGVLVVEATHRSGSLITARLALEQGREVFAVPGSPLDPRAKGPNDLIRQGAVLVQQVEDILEVLFMMDGKRISEPDKQFFEGQTIEEPTARDIDSARLDIKEKLSHTAIEIDDLIRMTGRGPGEVQTVLLELELAGEITRHPGNRVSFC